MRKEELDFYMGAVEILKDDKKSFSDEKVMLVLRRFHETPVEKRKINGGISFLIANAIRKHRGLAYPKVV